MSTNDGHAVYCGFTLGPTFGDGFDIHIASDSNSNKDSFSNFGLTYRHADYLFGTKKANSILAGANKFQTAEIEVFVATN